MSGLGGGIDSGGGAAGAGAGREGLAAGGTNITPGPGSDVSGLLGVAFNCENIWR